MEPNDGASVKTTKMTKANKKVIRKQLKASHTLLKHEGIETVSYPTQNLVVANGGLGNGVSREQLQDILKGSSSVKCLLMPPNKPYAFVTYGCTEDARQCHAALNGRQLQCQGRTVTLYLSFVDKVVESHVGMKAEMPPGLKVLEDFVSPEEEVQLLEAVDWSFCDDPGDNTIQKTLKHRRVKHFGYEFRYDNNNVDKNKPLSGGLPAVCHPVLERCLKEKHISIWPDQLTVNQYQPGQGIPPHVDTHSAFEDTILSLSLGAKTVMDFRHPDGRSVAVVLPRRSLLLMKGESRYLWTHGITPRRLDIVPARDAERSVAVTPDPCDLTLNERGTRTSFTFRKVRHMPCDCAYPSTCDSQRPLEVPQRFSLPCTDVDAVQLEMRFVHTVYDEIAGHFSRTRHSPWPRVGDFLRSLVPGAVVADVGCGNGKYLGINPAVFTLGCDRSHSLVQICADRGFQAFTSDALEVPLRSGVCDACISIAVIHHFSTQERRLTAVKELVRLLKPGGKALLYVWALEQEYNRQKSKYLKERGVGPVEGVEPGSVGQMDTTAARTVGTSSSAAKSSQPELSIHRNRTAFGSQDLLVPWHLRGGVQKEGQEPSHIGEKGALLASGSTPVYHRYYHVFREGELEELCRKVRNATIETSYYDQGNWCVILEKTL
ncbi:alkylated DNA repair protein alkB homolog 8 isoform X3 [Scleropages formosus]|uniref:alkylated DNA repair protein alkB homolog 8 isoform X3 n=1 Tax=Scleropages formosus TaxID=113540 RepID=UPI0008787C45|nr:alkylated DNA repair protein alkB homolog 8 isoform X3 [Scleropages formosus]